MPPRLTTEKFIEKAIAVYGDKYDYSLVEYKSTSSKVKIVCKNHGIFEQTPNQHLHGRECGWCSGTKKLTNDMFIDRALMIHGDRFDYSLAHYTGMSNDVIIICPSHGEFKQNASNHLNGFGCPACSGNKRLNTDYFISRSQAIHGGKYDYSKTKIIGNNKDKVEIICPKHGLFKQKIISHLNGRGCNRCGKESMAKTQSLSTDEFVLKAVNAHGDKYDYSLVEYVNSSTKVKIKCHIHGLFDQLPFCHIRGSGCPNCTRHGFKTGEPASIYVLRSECGTMMKIGISNKVNKRISYLRENTPFDFSVINISHLNGDLAKKAERKLHSKFKPLSLTGFNGCTEWFEYDHQVNDELERVLHEQN